MININKSEIKGGQSTMVDDNRNSPLSRHLNRRRTLFGKIKPSARCAGINSPAKSKITFSKERNSPGVSVQSLPLRRFHSAKKSSSTSVHRRSQIPRALLLANSISSVVNIDDCDNSDPVKTGSETTPTSAALVRVPQTLQEATVFTEGPNGSTTTVQRQNNSNIIVSFQRRRSQSQMEFSPQSRRVHAQQVGKYQQNHHHHHHHHHHHLQASQSTVEHQSSCQVVSPRLQNDVGDSKASSTTFLLQKIYDHRLYEGIHTPESHTAGMRIFCHIMLNAWRKRRDEVRRLIEEVDELKRASVKSKNQLHVFNTLFRMEQKRNTELSAKLKCSLEDNNATKSSCEGLTTSLISLKADKALLEQQLHIKDQEYQSLNALLNQAKADLLKAMGAQREVQADLSIEQHKVQVLENQKNELINEIYELNGESATREQTLKLKIDVKEKEIQGLHESIEEMKKKLETAQIAHSKLIVDHNLYEEHMVNDVNALRKEVECLQGCLKNTFLNRLKMYWANSMRYQQYSFHLLHLATYVLLPATPPPKIMLPPLTMGVTKSLSVMKK